MGYVQNQVNVYFDSGEYKMRRIQRFTKLGAKFALQSNSSMLNKHRLWEILYQVYILGIPVI